jgi:hypothetical protein
MRTVDVAAHVTGPERKPMVPPALDMVLLVPGPPANQACPMKTHISPAASMVTLLNDGDSDADMRGNDLD